MQLCGFSELWQLRALSPPPQASLDLPGNRINLSTPFRTAGPWRALLCQRPQKCPPSFFMMSNALFFEMYASIIKLKGKIPNKDHSQWKEAYSLSRLIGDLPRQRRRAGDKVKAVSVTSGQTTKKRTPWKRGQQNGRRKTRPPSGCLPRSWRKQALAS